MELFLIKIIILICEIVAISVEARKVNLETEVLTDHDGKGLVVLLRGRNGRKSLDASALARAKILYQALKKKIARQDAQPVEQPEADTRNDDATLVEHELEDALAKKSSALQDKPFVQHKGKNDFLVFHAGVQDPFVTIVPNDIYYNVEKRCVNWLEDCNERGIRARLLQKVQGPYR